MNEEENFKTAHPLTAVDGFFAELPVRVLRSQTGYETVSVLSNGGHKLPGGDRIFAFHCIRVTPRADEGQV